MKKELLLVAVLFSMNICAMSENEKGPIKQLIMQDNSSDDAGTGLLNNHQLIKTVYCLGCCTTYTKPGETCLRRCCGGDNEKDKLCDVGTNGCAMCTASMVNFPDLFHPGYSEDNDEDPCCSCLRNQDHSIECSSSGRHLLNTIFTKLFFGTFFCVTGSAMPAVCVACCY